MKPLAGLFAALIALNALIFAARHAPVRVVVGPPAAPASPLRTTPSDHERLEAMGRVLKAQQEQLDHISPSPGPEPLIRGVRGPTPDENVMMDQATTGPLIRDVHN